MITVTVTVNIPHPVHIHMHEEPSLALLDRVASLESRMNAIAGVGGTMATMTQAVTKLTDEVAQARTVADSAKTLVASLAQQIRDNHADPAAILALADSLDATNAELAAAVTANTSADTTTGATTGAGTTADQV